MVLGPSNLLVGRAAQINFSQLPAWQKARYQPVPAGVYSIGHRDYEDNPPRQVTLEKPLQVKQTVVTQSEFLAVREALGDQNHLVMALLPGNRQSIVARGTEAAIEALSPKAILEMAQEHVLEGGLLTRSDMEPFEGHEMQAMTFLSFFLHCGKRTDKNFLGDDYPAHTSHFMARAVAALSLDGDELLTSDEWEVAAGNLREEKYFDPEELAKVAYFGQERPTRVGTLGANNFGLQDMLGLVWEYVAEEEVLRGGSSHNNPEHVRAAHLVHVDGPVEWLNSFGFRLVRRSISSTES